MLSRSAFAKAGYVGENSAIIGLRAPRLWAVRLLHYQRVFSVHCDHRTAIIALRSSHCDPRTAIIAPRSAMIALQDCDLVHCDLRTAFQRYPNLDESV